MALTIKHLAKKIINAIREIAKEKRELMAKFEMRVSKETIFIFCHDQKQKVDQEYSGSDKSPPLRSDFTQIGCKMKHSYPQANEYDLSDQSFPQYTQTSAPMTSCSPHFN
ncbi:CLUMA_CG021478, isoform A [Clunio marinus]|uniref:CLUMA_CG021478, isoform A n=1 Tax=Clunio marinus TaxID=568069 RepID=A0A1J1J7D0_9DIPT|nr:CLUMA_CG021478, isoform A [Clunio marinus]